MEEQNQLQVCPICEEAGRMDKKTKKLYGYQVCKKCYQAFLNRRQGAFLIDLLVWYFLMGSVGFFFPALPSDGSLLFVSLFFWGIFFLKDGFSGQSPGKAVLGLQVIHEPSGKPIGLLASLKRNWMMIIPLVIIFLISDIRDGYRLWEISGRRQKWSGRSTARKIHST